MNYLKECEKSNLITRFVPVKRIVWKSGLIKGEEALIANTRNQVSFFGAPFSMEHKGKIPSILIDFGFEFCGKVKLLIASLSSRPLQLRYRFGESCMEAMDELGQKGSTNDHATRDGLVSVDGIGSMIEIGPSGFRFLRLDLLSKNSKVSFQGILGMATCRDIELKGSFKSNDKRLNKIWDSAAYTVYLNMQDYIWDGIKRDRLVWIGDLHPEISTIQAVFGNDETIEKSLDFAKADTPLPNYMNAITTYSLWWIICHYNYYMQNGNFEYLIEQKDYLIGLIKQISHLIDEEGREIMPERRFFDWPNNEDLIAKHAGLQGILTIAFDCASKLFNYLGEEEHEKLCIECVERLRKHKPDTNNKKQATAFLSLAGIEDPKKMNEIIKVGGPKGFSTFLGYYILQAQALAGDVASAIDNIKDYWGPMLDRGATTFWEDFNVEWLEGSGRIDELVKEGEKDIHGNYGAHCYKGHRHSLCHGWASGPAAFLSQYVLGVHILEAGCKKILIKPELGNLKWVEGTYPTPEGIIYIRHEKDDKGNIKTSVNGPKGIVII